MKSSIFELFKIGIGPSSSHTMGPMVAAADFVEELDNNQILKDANSIIIRLYGSLALTGKGHFTDAATLLGLEGAKPDTIDPNSIDDRLNTIYNKKEIALNGKKVIAIDFQRDIKFLSSTFLPYHPNALSLTIKNKLDQKIANQIFYSIGGGIIERKPEKGDPLAPPEPEVPYPFSSASDLLKMCEETGKTIAEIVLENEKTRRDEKSIKKDLEKIWNVMTASIERGCSRDGILPGGLNVERKAKKIYNALLSKPESAYKDPLCILDWVNLFALAVNEENASLARVVTAPTNGAAGVVPAVLRYYEKFTTSFNKEGIFDFLLTAGAIGLLFAKNASISGAEVGCQGEVGVACSMAAGGLAAVLGGSPYQIEQAAEIGIEHNLGLTCDPIKGLVQIPCIERNAMAAVKAINAARLALRSDGKHHVTLDSAIETMKQTGKDMQKKYKETSQGGLAVNVVEC